MRDYATVRTMPAAQYFALVRQSLQDTGQAYVRVTGASMRPLLRHRRDGVILGRPETLRRGDIVLFDRGDGRYALHRVIRLRPTGFDMAGDHQRNVETDLPYAQVVGVVTAVDRGGRRISRSNFFFQLLAFLLPRLAELRINVRKALTAGRSLLKRGRA